jgi:DNA (cytosine-5)-methyltransferase 1
MKYISLFAGIGGFDLALNRLGHECVYANDFDKYCKIIYDKNFTEIRNGDWKATQGYGASSPFEQGMETKRQGIRSYGNSADNNEPRTARKVSHHPALDTTSITEVKAADIPDHDLLVGGFPCQAFSVAGKRGGFNDTRGTLFFDIARILKHKRPRYFILENVKGLLSHDGGKTFTTILGVLTDLGYEYQWRVLNSKNHGVPQNRERIFIIGNLRGQPRPKIFSFGSNDEVVIAKNVTQTANTITANYWKGPAASRPFVVTKDGNAHTLDANYYKGLRANQARTGVLVQRIPLKFLTRNQKNIEGDYAYTVDSMNTGGVKVNDVIRRLTPIECERLQGFPDNWTQGVSDTQRYKQLGNAVTVNVVEYVASLLP